MIKTLCIISCLQHNANLLFKFKGMLLSFQHIRSHLRSRALSSLWKALQLYLKDQIESASGFHLRDHTERLEKLFEMYTKMTTKVSA